MNEEELREIIKAKNKPIRDIVELSKHFRGRRNCIVFLTESFRIDLDNRMSRLAMLEGENKKLREEIEELEAKLEFKQFGDLDSLQFENTYLDKQVIRDKLKELEDYIEEFKPQGYIEDELNAKISVLKELLEGEK